MNESDSAIPARLWDLILRLTVPMVVALAASVIYHEVRLSVIESNRFTAEDATGMERRIRETLPPEWLREDLAEIKGLLREMDTRLDALERKVGQ